MMKKTLAVFKDRDFLKSFVKLVIPVMLTTFLSNIINFVDNIMVGAYSDNAVSAVYAVNQITFIFNIMIFGIVAGAGIFVQQYTGKSDMVHVRQAFHFKIITLIVLCLICIPILMVFKGNFIDIFLKSNDNKEAIKILAEEYFSIIIFSFIPFIFTVALSTTLREMGHTASPIIASFCSLIVNITANALMINGVWHLGVTGAALATLTSQIVGFIVNLVVVLVKKYPFIQDFFNFKIDAGLLKKISISSIPVVINEFLWSLAMVILTAFYSQTGTVLSALSITSTASEIFNIIFVGFSTGIGVMIGHKLGEGKIEEAKENGSKLLVLAVAVCLLSLLLMIGLSFVLPLCYSEVSTDQKQLAQKLIFCYALAIPFFGINSSIMNIMRSGGRTLLAFVIDAGSTWAITIPLAYCLVTFSSLPLVVLYLCVCSMDIVRVMISFPLYRHKNLWARDLTRIKMS